MIGGIADDHWQKILSVLYKHSNINHVILYGSRAKGNFRNGSDIDIAIKGSTIADQQLTQIFMDYDDLYLPWKMDVTLYDTLTNIDLKDHIDRVGIDISAFFKGHK